MISGFFAIGKEPTGSKDPFALRRAAINIIKAIKKHEIRLSLNELIDKAISQLPNIESNPKITKKVVDFIMERLKVILKDEGINHDIISALMEQSNDILIICKKATILNEFIGTPVGERLISIGKRAKNIIDSNDGIEIDASLFSEREEYELFNALNKLEIKLSDIRKNETDINSRFTRELNACVDIEETVENFFDKVLVNTEDSQVKQNRLNLVTKLAKILETTV